MLISFVAASISNFYIILKVQQRNFSIGTSPFVPGTLHHLGELCTSMHVCYFRNVPGLYQVRGCTSNTFGRRMGDVKWPSGRSRKATCSQQQKTVGFQSLEAGGCFATSPSPPHVCAGVREPWNFVSPLSLSCFYPLCLPPCFPLCLPLCLLHCVSHCVCHLVSQLVFHLVSHLVFPLCPPLSLPPCVPLCLPFSRSVASLLSVSPLCLRFASHLISNYVSNLVFTLSPAVSPTCFCHPLCCPLFVFHVVHLFPT